ncbi:hypothetical protein [Bradyrhizobium sp. UFLA05-112]
MFARLAGRVVLAAALLAWFAPAFAQAPGPVPALPDQERRTSYNITSSMCSCAVGFQLYADSNDVANWLEVWVNGTRITQAGNWTITSPTGSLATIPRPITDAVLTFTQAQTGTVQIVGARRPRRTSQFAENRGVAARDLNQAITDIVAMLREDWDKINDVSGRAVLAPPGETLTVLAASASRANSGACFDSGGNLVSCVSIPSTTFTAGNGISITGTSPKTITNNIQGGGPITITGTNPLIIGCPTCNTTPAAATPALFVSARATATALDLHTFNVVQTGGYAAAGDGGGATFKNVGSAAFIDSFIATGNLTAPGSAYTNGTYRGVALTGGTGTGAIATVTVAGNVVTGVTITGTGGNGYAAGDVLSATAASMGGTGSGFTWTVATVTTPTGSFTDSVGTHFQLVVDQGTFVNVRQFGAVLNWNGSDGTATNDAAAFQNTLSFASARTALNIDTPGHAGSVVMVPAGSSLICGGLMVPVGVTLRGQGPMSSSLKQCDSDAATQHFITLCDPQAHIACFGSAIREIKLYTGSGSANSAIAMIYTNASQQLIAVDNVAVYSGKRSCLVTDTGYGGASNFIANVLFCTPSNTTTNPGIIIGYTAAVTTLRDSIVEASALTGNAVTIVNAGGIVNIDGFHSEGISSPIFFNVTAGGILVNIHNVTGSGGSACVDLITRQSGSTSGAIVVGTTSPGNCTHTFNNAGSFTTGAIVANQVF